LRGTPRLAGVLLLGLILAGAAVGGIAHYELTPTPVLGHADPHASGAAGVVQRVLSGSDALIAGAPGTSATPPEVAAPAEVKRAAPRTGFWIEIPALSIALPIQRGDGSDRIPQWAALVYPGTVWPGDPGNSYVYAHGYWEMFGGLLYAKRGDTAYLHNYDTGVVLEMHVSKVVGRVAYNDSHWLSDKAAAPTLTLQTCVDYTPKGDRFIVQVT
jgi:LPXTG-site transpeptidase (sortase) family protein